ncbi:MAG: hypothetical protein ACPGUV_11920 [Polyangiales bacterium]
MLEADAKAGTFLQVFTYEVAAGVLRQSGYKVAPRKVASDRLKQSRSAALDCAARDDCVRALATELRTPMLLFITLEPAKRRRVQLNAQGVVITTTRIERLPPVVARGKEKQVADQVRRAAAALAEQPAPCTLEVAARVAGHFRVDTASSQPLSTAPLFLTPGKRHIWVQDKERKAPPFEGELQCDSGRRYRMHVKLTR